MSEFSIKRVGQIGINVKDLDRAVAFYRDVLGLDLHMQVPGMAFFDCAGQQLMLALPSKPEFDHPSSILYFEVPDARTSYELLLARDVPFEAPPFIVHRKDDTELWMAFFRDPENNLHALSSLIPVG